MKHILTAIDFSDATDAVLDTTVTYAKAFGATVTLLHTEPPEPDFVGYEPGPQYVREAAANRVKTDRKQLHEIKEQLETEGIDTTCLVIQGPTAEKIRDEAIRLGAELLIIGSHEHGAFHDMLFGSVRNTVARHTPCPLLIIPV